MNNSFDNKSSKHSTLDTQHSTLYSKHSTLDTQHSTLDTQHKFYNPTTKFNPNYRNIQSELWVYLSDQQQAIVGGVFRHLKNHAQIELAMALINYIESDYTDMPDVLDFTDALTSGIFHYLVQQMYKGTNPSTLNH